MPRFSFFNLKSKKKHEFLTARRTDSKDELLNGGGEEEITALVPWFFENIPNSYKQWLIGKIAQRADKLWGLDDEYTVSSTYENIEFYLRNRTMTKEDKRQKVIGLLRAYGVKGASEFTGELFDQLEIFVQRSDESRAANRQRQSKQVLVDSTSSPQLARRRQRSSSLY